MRNQVKVVTVRMSEEQHARLKNTVRECNRGKATGFRVSMNGVCVSIINKWVRHEEERLSNAQTQTTFPVPTEQAPADSREQTEAPVP